MRSACAGSSVKPGSSRRSIIDTSPAFTASRTSRAARRSCSSSSKASRWQSAWSADRSTCYETLSIARQIADAVESAHEQGIIHRDLKPANIKVRSDGIVKVLDFGLARATLGTDLDAPTITSVATKEGLVMGTAAYMSPEQARGRLVDRRTDIWAFGCVLFELLSGRRAFAAESTTETLTMVLHREPDWQALPQDTPASIRELVTRCLRKDQRQRLRDMGDARIVIEETLASPHQEQPVIAPRRHRLAPPLFLAGMALASALVTYGATTFASRGAGDASPARFAHVVRFVASSAHEFSPVISPDGKWVAYLSNARGPTDIWLKSVTGGDARNLTGTLDIEIQTTDWVGGIDLSPDGTQLAFAGALPGAVPGSGSIYVMPAPLGGPPQRRLKQGYQGMRWSPNGKHIAYITARGASGDNLLVADADGQNEREIVKRERARHIHWTRWSADGRHVYFNYGFQNSNIEQTEIYRAPVEGGVPEPVVATARRAVFPLPSPDGRGLFFAANPDGVQTNIYWRNFKGGPDQRVTFGIGEYGSPSISADGRRLVAMVSDLRQSLQRIPVRFQGAVALEALTDGYTGDIDPSWSADGARVVFSSTRTGNRNIWSARADLSNPVALTSDSWIDERPAYSPDGTQVAFVSDRGGRRGIWVVSADGGTPRAVASADVLDGIAWSRDGKRLVYAAPGAELPQVEIVEVSSGKVTRLPTSKAASSPVWSPVEDVIAYVEHTPNVGGFVRFMTGDGGALSRGPIDSKEASLANPLLRWSTDGKRLAGISLPGNRNGSIWIVDPLGSQPSRKLIELPPDTYVRGATWSA